LLVAGQFLAGEMGVREQIRKRLAKLYVVGTLAKPPGGVHTMIECLHIKRAALLCANSR
jgi:hypothetical protein